MTGVHSGDEAYIAIKIILGIPQDEPIFIFRAQDRYSAGAITAYRCTVEGDEASTIEWIERVKSDVREFRNWQRNNPDRVKAPD